MIICLTVNNTCFPQIPLNYFFNILRKEKK